jgi:hypothetical protein
MPTTTPTRTRTAAPNAPKRKAKDELARYRESGTGAVRTIVTMRGAGNTTLVIDQLAGTKADPRVVDVLLPDEDPSNAQLIATMYAEDENRGARALVDEDLRESVAASSHAANGEHEKGREDAESLDHADGVVDDDGVRYCVREVDGGKNGSPREMRWVRVVGHECEIVTLRETIAHFESYTPFMAMSEAAASAYGDDQEIAVSTLHSELRRQQASPIVLNRGIREAVLRVVETEQASLSEIAARCGRSHSGNDATKSGDTTWLQRRIGVRKESGTDAPTHWVHTEVLALIAREGLGIAPHEVEL